MGTEVNQHTSAPRPERRYRARFPRYAPSDVIEAFFELPCLAAVGSRGVQTIPPVRTNIYISHVSPGRMRFDCGNRSAHYWSYDLIFEEVDGGTDLTVYYLDYSKSLPMMIDWWDAGVLDQDISAVVFQTGGSMTP